MSIIITGIPYGPGRSAVKLDLRRQPASEGGMGDQKSKDEGNGSLALTALN